MPTSKKIFIISAIALGVVLIFLGVYNFAFKKEKSRIYEVPSSKSNLEETAVPEKTEEKGKIYSLSGKEIVSAALLESTEKVMYFSADGNLIELDIVSGKERDITSESLKGIKSVIWSPDRSQVILKIIQEGKEKFIFYDLDDGTQKELKAGIDYVAWTNLGDRIIYKYFDSASLKKSVNISSPDGSNWEKLAEVPWRKVNLSQIPGSSVVTFWNYPNSFEETALETVGITGGAVKKIFSGRFGADYLWSPDGERVLISSSDSRGATKMVLAVANKNGGQYQNLDVPTLVSKCVWTKDSKNVFCALPSSIPEGSVMPNDYQESKFKTKDTFWKIDVVNGKKERVIELAEIDGSYDAVNLFLSSEEDKLMFINRIDGLFYVIEL